MLRPVWKKCLLLAALMVAGVTLSASPAQAGWGHHRAGGYGWYGYGCYPTYVYTTSFCSPCVTGYGGAWGSPFWSGCYSGWYSGLYVGGYGGYYSSYYAPSYGSYGVTSGCCDTVVEPQGDAGAIPTPAPPAAGEPAAAPPAPEPASVLPTPPPPTAIPPAPDANVPAAPDAPVLPPAPGDAPKPTAGSPVPTNATLFTVVVPQDAKVYVNGMLTKTTGTQRQYISYGLRPGYTYTYEVRVQVSRNGQTQDDVQLVQVRPGEERRLAFDFGARPDVAIAARLR